MEAVIPENNLQYEKWGDRRCHNIIEQNLDEWPQKSGFVRDTFEKVLRLKEILKFTEIRTSS